MQQSLESKLKKLELEIAIKNAYLTVQMTFPKGSKLPEEVKDQVIKELKNACASLAESVSNGSSFDVTSSKLTDEELLILKQIVSKVKIGTSGGAAGGIHTISVTDSIASGAEGVESNVLNGGSMHSKTESNVDAPKNKTNKIFDAGQDGVKKAMIVTLDNVDHKYRNRINPEEEVYVTSIKDDGYARISVKRTGLSINIPVEDLDFNTK